MGNTSQSSSTYNVYKQEKFTHPKFEKAKVKQNLTKQPIIENEISLENESQYRNWAERVTENPGIGQEGVLTPIAHKYRKTGICGTNGIAEITYENYPFTLKDQIGNRQGIQQKYFNEAQLWYLLAMLTNVGEKFHSVGKKIGDVRPQNVFINDNGEIKASTQYSWPNQLTNYEKAYTSRQKTYISPQQCRDLQLGKDHTIANVSSAQAFSVGLTLFDAALLQNSSLIYDKNCAIIFQKLKKMKNVLIEQNKFKNQFKCVLLALTQISPERRLNLLELKNIIEPYSGQILELQPFKIAQLPQKLRQVMINQELKEDIYENENQYELKQDSYKNDKDSPQNRKMIESLGNKPQPQDITFTFGRKNIKTSAQFEKTRETTTMMRSQTSNLMKSPSPQPDLCKKPQQKLPIVYNKINQSPKNAFKTSRPVCLKRQISNQLLYYQKSSTQQPKIPKPAVKVQFQNHPYFTNMPNVQNSHNNNISQASLPIANKVSMKEEGKVRINFRYQDNNKPEIVPSAIKRLDSNSSNKMIPSNKSLQLQSVKHSRKDFVENRLLNGEYFPSSSSMYFCDQDSKNDEPIMNRTERSSSLKDLDQKIALSRRMFPY